MSQSFSLLSNEMYQTGLAQPASAYTVNHIFPEDTALNRRVTEGKEKKPGT